MDSNGHQVINHDVYVWDIAGQNLWVVKWTNKEDKTVGENMIGTQQQRLGQLRQEVVHSYRVTACIVIPSFDSKFFHRLDQLCNLNGIFSGFIKIVANILNASHVHLYHQ